ncbi:MAG: 4-phytase [Rhodovulum sulfidophilum]|uniref:4-phytase n=1 Tax=Rhodovulum sulfidophilum TaxID=35806 RepID=A0A2W5N3E0_RHOSU|nr:MAG: 4-phytase [Rhodovulum sulfidophilum]
MQILKFLATAAVAALLGQQALADKVVRIGITASDIPTATGSPNNGFEGFRFLGYPVFESLVLWDLSQTETNAGLRPGLAESWSQDPDDPKVWIFKLREGVKFHDGTDFDADAVIWNMDRYFDKESPQFDARSSANSVARMPLLESYAKIDDHTVSMTTKRPGSYFPYNLVYILFASPNSWEQAGHDWAAAGTLPTAGTGPFKILGITPRVSAELGRFDGYWDKDHLAKLDRVEIVPIPDPSTRVAALRSGQVDWIEAVPPDAIDALKAAGLTYLTNPYPQVWGWYFNIGATDSPFTDLRVRQALNYCVDRDGIVALLNGTAQPAVSWLKESDPHFGAPKERYSFDPEKGKALLAEAGYGPDHPLAFKVMIPTSGSGFMQPLPMNEFLQQTLKSACGVDVAFDPQEVNTTFAASRAAPDDEAQHGTLALNNLGIPSDPGITARYFSSANFTPNGGNYFHWKDEAFDAAVTTLENATDQATIDAAYTVMSERLTDDPPFMWVVHDLNPRAFNPKVTGVGVAQSNFIDLTTVDITE